ncbi:MAG: tetratricopeptide repeat protein [Candidatus Hydrogenedentota bacterium]
MLSVILTLFALLLLIPYVGWGIYVLRRKLIFHEDFHRSVQWGTLVGVILFLVIEMKIVQVPLGAQSGLYTLTTLALLMSTTALYGHLFVSMFSQLIVDIIHPPVEQPAERPDFAAAEALEEIGDYTGALNEYMVIARIFPRDVDPIVKIAETHLELNDIDEAVRYFEMGLKKIDEPQHALGITNRLFGLYHGILNSGDKAKDVLNRYLDRFPESEYADSVRGRLERLDAIPEPKPFKSVTDLLEPPPSDLLR